MDLTFKLPFHPQSKSQILTMLWNKLASLLSGPEEHVSSDEEIREAIAVLLIHAAKIDGQEDESEREKRDALLKRKFELSDEELTQLTSKAEALDAEAVDLYQFTSVLTRNFDQDGRKAIVRMLWEIVLADGALTDYEANYMWRVAELLGVTTRDRIALRKAVEQGL
ncbi:MAG: TerB family tellurite resistance protein [Pseudomonadota bacterium]